MDVTERSSLPYTGIAASFLGLVGLAHLLRAAAGWSIVIQDWPVPVWWSGAVAVPLLALATMLWREARR